MASAHLAITSTGPVASSDDDRLRLPGRNVDMADGLRTFLVCTAAVLLVTAVLQVILLVRFDPLSNPANTIAVAFMAAVIGGSFVALSAAVVFMERTATRLRLAAEQSLDVPSEDDPLKASLSGLAIATRVEPRSPLVKVVPAPRPSRSERLAAARRPAPPPSRPNAPRPIIVRAVAPRSMAAPQRVRSAPPMTAPQVRPGPVVRSAPPIAPPQVPPQRVVRSAPPMATPPPPQLVLRPAPPMAAPQVQPVVRSAPPMAAPPAGNPPEHVHGQKPGPSNGAAPQLQPVGLPLWQVQASSRSVLDRLLGRLPHPVGHP